MSKLDPTLWRDMISYLRHQHTSICRQWFHQLEPVEFDSGLLRIYTDNAVQQHYLQQKCRQQFTEAAQNVTGKLVAVRFETGQPEAEIATARPADNGQTDPPLQRHGSLSTPSAHSAPITMPAGPASLGSGVGIDDLSEDQMVLSPDYSFDNFITGPNNQLAYAASVAVANQPGTAYNPLFIHGGVGLGKTHLLQAICQRILTDRPGTQILYVSCDAFMNQFIACVQSGKMNEFRHRYRHVDVLVIDDIHFLGHRERSQEEFFHTFNEMYQSNRQIVLSSDAAPAEIPHLEERLLSRFQWGLVAMVSQPHYETRVAILRAKAALRDLQVPDDVIAYIATKVVSNARELEGAITTLQGHASLQNRPIDMDLAREMLGDTAGRGGRMNQVTLESIIDIVVDHYNVRLSDLQSKKRHKSVTEPRQVCMWLARKRTRFSLEEIGGYFGGRDHTTVMHSIKTVDTRVNEDDRFADQINHLDQQIQRLGGEG